MTARTFARANALLWIPTLTLAALTAAAPGAAEAARDALAFELQPYPGSLDEAWVIALTNARVVAAVLLAALAVAFAPLVRCFADIAVALILIPNIGLVGVAAGAYAHDAPRWLVHLPLEWAALACALASYMTEREGAPGRDRSGPVAATGLVVAAALAETYLTPQ